MFLWQVAGEEVEEAEDGEAVVEDDLVTTVIKKIAIAT